MVFRFVIRRVLKWLKERRKTENGIIRCRDCGRRVSCQICEQCLGDDGYCSLAIERE